MTLAIILGISLEGAASIWALKWALSKSDQTFFSIFVGDALLRLAALGVVAWWLYAKQLPYVQPLLTFGFCCLAISLIQIPFLYKAQ